ncbi:hypothetical protein Tco_0368775 [Tanacetum coccineum]
MDDPNITMEEYIQLMADKARGRDHMFNWETATYDEEYCDDLNSFTDFETDFPAIVYNDASTSNQNVSSEPTVSIYNAIKSDIDFDIPFSDSEDEDYTFIYNKDLSSYKLVPFNDLKPEPCDGDIVDFRTWPGISLETSMMSTIDLAGVTCLTGREGERASLLGCSGDVGVWRVKCELEFWLVGGSLWGGGRCYCGELTMEWRGDASGGSVVWFGGGGCALVWGRWRGIVLCAGRVLRWGWELVDAWLRGLRRVEWVGV